MEILKRESVFNPEDILNCLTYDQHWDHWSTVGTDINISCKSLMFYQFAGPQTHQAMQTRTCKCGMIVCLQPWCVIEPTISKNKHTILVYLYLF